MTEAVQVDEEAVINSRSAEKKWDRLYIRDSDREDYRRLLEEDSPFAGKDNKDTFMMAMMMGYLNKNRVQLEDKKFGYVRYDYFTSSEQVVIKAIAITEEGNLNVLTDKKKIFTIAEEYAAGGIKLLKNEVFGNDYGSYPKKLESSIRDEFDRYEAIKQQPEMKG